MEDSKQKNNLAEMTDLLLFQEKSQAPKRFNGTIVLPVKWRLKSQIYTTIHG